MVGEGGSECEASSGVSFVVGGSFVAAGAVSGANGASRALSVVRSGNGGDMRTKMVCVGVARGML